LQKPSAAGGGNPKKRRNTSPRKNAESKLKKTAELKKEPLTSPVQRAPAKPRKRKIDSLKVTKAVHEQTPIKHYHSPPAPAEAPVPKIEEKYEPPGPPPKIEYPEAYNYDFESSNSETEEPEPEEQSSDSDYSHTPSKSKKSQEDPSRRKAKYYMSLGGGKKERSRPVKEPQETGDKSERERKISSSPLNSVGESARGSTHSSASSFSSNGADGDNDDGAAGMTHKSTSVPSTLFPTQTQISFQKHNPKM
jgi:hypothetical protein